MAGPGVTVDGEIESDGKLHVYISHEDGGRHQLIYEKAGSGYRRTEGGPVPSEDANEDHKSIEQEVSDAYDVAEVGDTYVRENYGLAED